MARRSENEPIYKVFHKFIEQCLIKDKSLLWPDENYWTLNNLLAVKQHYIEAPIYGREYSFEEKLEKQMANSSNAEWGIICDTYFIYFLPSTFITYDKRVKDIKWAAEKGNLKLLGQQDKIWEAQKHGFSRTGFKYHVKFAQFQLIILFAIAVKQHDEPRTTVNTPQVMQQYLDMLLENISIKSERAYDMRHAMLYMAFPDEYERIISTQDKKNIIKTYQSQVKDELPLDIDESLRVIRKNLSEKYDKAERPFDFYQELVDQRRPKKTKSTDTVVETEKGPVTIPTGEEPTDALPDTANEVSAHTEIQWLLLKLGSEMGLDIWVAKNDRNKEINGKRFSDLPRVKKELPLTFDVATNKIIELIDVIWLQKNNILAAFEIESTTSIYSGILRMADLISMQPNINIPLYIVAPEERRQKVFSEVTRPVFSILPTPMREICRYISFTSLREAIKQIGPMIKHLKPEFLDEFAEFCEIEETQN